MFPINPIPISSNEVQSSEFTAAWYVVGNRLVCWLVSCCLVCWTQVIDYTRGGAYQGVRIMKEQVQYLLARYITPRHMRVSLVVISVLLMALAGGAPDIGGGGGAPTGGG